MDDLGDLRETLCLQIAELGYRCEAVETAADALGVLEWWKPVVIVLEWSLRDGSGIGLSRKLRAWASDQYRPLLLILYSHHPESDEVKAAEAYDRYVCKPAKPAEIETAILEFLSA